MSCYQIFIDKILDLLSSSLSTKSKVHIDHYIDKQSDEVVSKLKNLTEKVVFSLEDFYVILQEAFKQRRLESTNVHDTQLRKKSHFIISFTLMKRSYNKRLSEVSHLNFVELSGSEQAVSGDDMYHKDNSVRQFVTKSFNSLSTQLLRSALKKKQNTTNSSTIDDEDSKLVNCLRNTLTSQSNIVFICCANPAPQHYEHNLPAIKFAARIRDCIIRKMNKG